MRNLIGPPPGWGLAYVDWGQQEIGIPGVLSGDQALLDTYCSTDPYLEFAKRAGIVPAHATKATHPVQRQLCKQCMLAVQYGMYAGTLAARLGQPPVVAREIMELHHMTYRTFWNWQQGVIDEGRLRGSLSTVFNWQMQVDSCTKWRTLGNFPMQGNGAEMLRLACIYATERGIRVCAPVHDALIIEAPIDRLDQEVKRTQDAMADASADVLGGFRLRTEAKLIKYPRHMTDPRGDAMWDTVRLALRRRAGYQVGGYLQCA